VTDEELEAALREARWDRTAAATALRVSRTSLYALLEKSQRFRTKDVTPEEVSRAFRECGGDMERMVDRLQVSERTIRWRLRKLGLEESGGQAAKPRGRAEGDGGA
jgi:two-component system nitrogen regulation response regulator GlnG